MAIIPLTCHCCNKPAGNLPICDYCKHHGGTLTSKCSAHFSARTRASSGSLTSADALKMRGLK